MKTKMYGLRWNGFYCPNCKRKSIIHCLQISSEQEENNTNVEGEKFPTHLIERLSSDQSQYCMNCRWWGIITEF